MKYSIAAAGPRTYTVEFSAPPDPYEREGLRAVTPEGKLLAGQSAADAMLAGARADRMSILLGGYSRGTMATGWAMTRNSTKPAITTCPVPPAVLRSGTGTSRAR